MGFKEFLKTTFPALVAVLLFLLVVIGIGTSLVETITRWVAGALYQDTDVLELALPPDLGENAYVYTSQMYPEGLRQVSKTVVDPKEALYERVVIHLRDLRGAQKEELEKRGTFAEPLIMVTGFARSGGVFVHGVEVFWEELPKNVKLVLTPLRDVYVLEEQSGDANPAPIEEARLEPLDGCKVAGYRFDEHEWTAPAVVMGVLPDNITWETILYAYSPHVQVGSGVNIFVASKWTSAGLLWGKQQLHWTS